MMFSHANYDRNIMNTIRTRDLGFIIATANLTANTNILLSLFYVSISQWNLALYISRSYVPTSQRASTIRAQNRMKLIPDLLNITVSLLEILPRICLNNHAP